MNDTVGAPAKDPLRSPCGRFEGAGECGRRHTGAPLFRVYGPKPKPVPREGADLPCIVSFGVAVVPGAPAFALWDALHAMPDAAGAVTDASEPPGAMPWCGMVAHPDRAAVNINPSVITALIEGGADPGARGGIRGITPLHGAAAVNINPSVITALIEAGADPGAAVACQTEDWRWQYVEFYKMISIEGTTTCETGKITIRAYDGNGKFVGTGWGFIEGHVFTITPIMDILRKPRSLNIKSAIDDGNTFLDDFNNLNKLLKEGRFE